MSTPKELAALAVLTLAALTGLVCKTNKAPDAPVVSGPGTGREGDTLSYTLAAIDPEDQVVAYMVAWGDTSPTEWSSSYASGQPIVRKHVYADSGVYGLTAKARDAEEAESDWSSTLTVNVARSVDRLPRDLSGQRSTDTTVLLTWTHPTQGPPDSYRVYFKDVQSSAFQMCASPDGSERECVVNPHGSTGSYALAGVFAGREYFCADTFSTVPVHTGPLTVNELNAAGNSGYGWMVSSGLGSTYDMSQAANAASVDFYVSDWAAGAGSGPFYVISPDLGPTDPGGTVPYSSWRVNGLVGVASAHSPLPPHRTGEYFASEEITTYPMFVACCVFGRTAADDCFALVRVSDRNDGDHSVKVEGWYQPVKGLRLIKH